MSEQPNPVPEHDPVADVLKLLTGKTQDHRALLDVIEAGFHRRCLSREVPSGKGDYKYSAAALEYLEEDDFKARVGGALNHQSVPHEVLQVCTVRYRSDFDKLDPEWLLNQLAGDLMHGVLPREPVCVLKPKLYIKREAFEVEAYAWTEILVRQQS